MAQVINGCEEQPCVPRVCQQSLRGCIITSGVSHGALDQARNDGKVDSNFWWLHSGKLSSTPVGHTSLCFFRKANLHMSLHHQEEALDHGYRLQDSELRFQIELSSAAECCNIYKLRYFLAELFEPANCSLQSDLTCSSDNDAIAEIIPWQQSTVIWLEDAAALCVGLGLEKVVSIQLKYCYLASAVVAVPDWQGLCSMLHGGENLMAAMAKPMANPSSKALIPVLERCQAALHELSKAQGPAEHSESFSVGNEDSIEENLRLIREHTLRQELRRNTTFRRVRAWCQAASG